MGNYRSPGTHGFGDLDSGGVAFVDQAFQTQIIKHFIRNACFFVGESNKKVYLSKSKRKTHTPSVLNDQMGFRSCNTSNGNLWLIPLTNNINLSIRSKKEDLINLSIMYAGTTESYLH